MSVVETHPPAFSTRLLTPAAWGLSVVAVVSILFQASRTELLDANDGCGWDGGQYCLMAQGQWSVIAPFSRRVFVPWLVSLMDPDHTVDGFRVVNLVALAAAAIGVALLARQLGVTRGPHLAVLLALFLLNPWTFRIWFSYPALTDHVSLLLLLTWIGLVLRRQSWASWTAVPVLVLLVLTREQWAILGVFGVWLAVGLGFQRVRWGLTSSLVAGLAGAFVFSRQNATPPSTMSGLLEFWWGEMTTGPWNAARFVFQAACGLGFLAALVVLNARSVFADRRLLFIAVFAIVTFGVTAWGGSDVDRIVSPVGILLGVVGTALAHRDERLTIPLVFLTVATVVLWHPFHTISSASEDWLQFYAIRFIDLGIAIERMKVDAAAAALPLLIAGASWWSEFRPRRRPEAVDTSSSSGRTVDVATGAGAADVPELATSQAG